MNKRENCILATAICIRYKCCLISPRKNFISYCKVSFTEVLVNPFQSFNLMTTLIISTSLFLFCCSFKFTIVKRNTPEKMSLFVCLSVSCIQICAGVK